VTLDTMCHGIVPCKLGLSEFRLSGGEWTALDWNRACRNADNCGQHSRPTLILL